MPFRRAPSCATPPIAVLIVSSGRDRVKAAAGRAPRSLLLLGGGGGGRRRGGRGRGLALGRLLFFLGLLGLLVDLDDLDLGQAERAAAFLPPLLVHQDLDAFPAGQDVPRPLERVFPAEALVDGHCSSFALQARGPGRRPGHGKEIIIKPAVAAGKGRSRSRLRPRATTGVARGRKRPRERLCGARRQSLGFSLTGVALRFLIPKDRRPSSHASADEVPGTADDAGQAVAG